MQSKTLTDYEGNEVVVQRSPSHYLSFGLRGRVHSNDDDAFVDLRFHITRRTRRSLYPNDESRYYVDVVGGHTAHQAWSVKMNYVIFKVGEYEGSVLLGKMIAIYCEDDGQYLPHQMTRVHTYSGTSVVRSTAPALASGEMHGYHQGFRRDYTDSNTKYTIGFEVEKEDTYVVESYPLDDVDETGWCREEDSSLDDGFELVSPTYDLMSSMLDDDYQWLSIASSTHQRRLWPFMWWTHQHRSAWAVRVRSSSIRFKDSSHCF